MFNHHALETILLASLDTIKVDLLRVEDVARVYGKSNTLDFAGTLLGSRLVFDSDLGFGLL